MDQSHQNRLSEACSPEWISDYLNGALPTEQERLLESHLDSCVDCRRVLSEQAANESFWAETQSALQRSSDSTIPADELRRLADSLRLAYHASPKMDIERLEEDLNDGWKHWLGPARIENSLGRVLKYEVLSIIGQGGMGIVFRAIDTELNRVVALKTLAADVRFQSDARLRLFREARATALLSHPNIIPIYALETWAGVPFIVSPYICGGNLYDFALNNDLSIEQSLNMASQVAEALAVLHENGVVHRDLKPSNILINQETGQLILCDFGLARIESEHQITAENAIAGTPFFMSPEQASGMQIDSRSDLFSLGSLIYWLLTKQYPFMDSTKIGVIKKILDQEPVPLSRRMPGLSQAAQRLVQGLLIKDRDRRLGPASQVAEMLAKCLDHRQTEVFPIAGGSFAGDSLQVEDTPKQLGIRTVTVTALGLCTSFVLLGWMLRWISNQSDVTGSIIATGLVSSAGDAQSKPWELDRPQEWIPEEDDVIPFEDLGLPLTYTEREAIPRDLKEGRRLKRWLTRLSKMPTQSIPAEVIHLVVPLLDSEDRNLKTLATSIIDQSPFCFLADNEQESSQKTLPDITADANSASHSRLDVGITFDPFEEPPNPFQEVPNEKNDPK